MLTMGKSIRQIWVKAKSFSKLNKDSTRQAFLKVICNQLDAINLNLWKTSKKTGPSSIFQMQLLYDIFFANTMPGLTRMMAKFRGFMNKNTDCTRHTKMILA